MKMMDWIGISRNFTGPFPLLAWISSRRYTEASSSSTERLTTIPTKFSPALVATLSLVFFQRVVIIN